MSSGTEYYTVFSSDYSSSTVSLFNGVATVYDFIGYVDGIVAAAPSANYGFNIAMGGM